ncbi:hypothetical protein ABOM_004013 [Aspergillus bombycis]|uniref:N-acetyltransferase domain-containing protein n=1 Tax=Aspergillus bombycis TaxID=109264 RepID=A0A1F8ACQ9_9EURO|nr:hypothetical protein ABOM_004013 [Aspergillus bombycis]OGM49189.1 hypothetical protein ABOM_004013 [Aspergillus bombycis]
MISIQTARLDIRPLVLSDAEDVSKGTPDLSISQTIDWMLSRSLGPEADETTVSPTKEEEKEKKKSSPNVIFAVRELQPSAAFPGSKVIGTMGIKRLAMPLDPVGSNRVRWELGYGFHVGAWGKGYATEAARGLLGHFEEIKRALEGQGQGAGGGGGGGGFGCRGVVGCYCEGELRESGGAEEVWVWVGWGVCR